MKNTKYLQSAAILGTLAFFAGPGLAADLPSRNLPPVEDVQYEPERPVEWVGGWYLRGDIGIAMPQNPELRTVSPTSYIDYTREDAKNNAIFGVGFGYQFNNGLRTDLTLDYSSGQTIEGAGVLYTSFNNNIYSTPETFKARREAATLMANAYYDIGTWSGITPYVGAGVGVAWSELTQTSFAPDYAALYNLGYPSGYYAAPTRLENHSTYTFAWALMAGAAVRLTDFFDLDVGYRYLNTGNTKTGGYASSAYYNAFNSNWNDYTRVNNNGQHEIRVGLRYKFEP